MYKILLNKFLNIYKNAFDKVQILKMSNLICFEN